MSEIAVVRLTAGDDLAAAIGLLVRFFSEEGFATAPGTIAQNARRLAALDTCGLFAASCGGETIGVATVSLEFGIEFGWFAEMGDLYVVPPWRGRGVSRQLVAAVERYLVAKGASGYQVTVTPHAESQHGLRRFYESLGFASEGRLILGKRFQD